MTFSDNWIIFFIHIKFEYVEFYIAQLHLLKTRCWCPVVHLVIRPWHLHSSFRYIGFLKRT
jgi:hypothetical protein